MVQIMKSISQIYIDSGAVASFFCGLVNQRLYFLCFGLFVAQGRPVPPPLYVFHVWVSCTSSADYVIILEDFC